jgi:hypothetical protein
MYGLQVLRFIQSVRFQFLAHYAENAQRAEWRYSIIFIETSVDQ